MLYEITDENFEAEVLNCDIPCVIEFTAGWCTLCEQVVPVMEALSAKYEGKVKFCTANTDTQKKLRIKFAVAALPYIVMVWDDKRIPLFDELVNEERLAERIEHVLGGGDAPILKLMW